jgi:hypothetical protein
MVPKMDLGVRESFHLEVVVLFLGRLALAQLLARLDIPTVAAVDLVLAVVVGQCIVMETER